MGAASNRDIPSGRLEAFCRRWQVRKLSFFGSVLRNDFGPQGDVDVLVSFADDALRAARAAEFRRLLVSEYRDKMASGWIGRMAGVG